MSDLSSRVNDLYKSLDDFDAKDKPGALVVDMFEALVKMAREKHPDDPVIGALKKTESTSGRAIGSAGDMRAVLKQILSVE